MKKYLSLLCAALMLLTMMAGCGKEEDPPFFDWITADRMDLYDAPDLVLEEQDDQWNLGGWLYGNSVGCDIEFPIEDDYTITIEYSRPHCEESAVGYFYLYTPDDYQSVELEFPSTSKDDSWDTYDTVSFEIHMPAIMSMVTLEPVYTGDGMDHFINLRSIMVEGTKPWDGAYHPDANEEPYEEPDEESDWGDQGSEGDASIYDGWWVISPNYYEGVIPVLPAFYVDSQQGSWTRYNDMGEAIGTYSFYITSDDLITLTGEAMSDLELQYIDDVLFYTDDGHEAYVHVEDPGFPELGSYEGVWLLNNRGDTGVMYEITAGRAIRTEDGTVTDDLPYEVHYSGKQYPQESLNAKIESLVLEWPGPTLYPSKDGQTIIEKAAFQNFVFTRMESDYTQEYVQYLDALVNSTFCSYDDPQGSTYKHLVFDPDFTFDAVTFAPDAGGGASPDMDEPEIIGTWELDADLTLYLHYNDGMEESIDLQDWNGELTLSYLDIEYILDTYWPG